MNPQTHGRTANCSLTRRSVRECCSACSAPARAATASTRRAPAPMEASDTITIGSSAAVERTCEPPHSSAEVTKAEADDDDDDEDPDEDDPEEDDAEEEEGDEEPLSFACPFSAPSPIVTTRTRSPYFSLNSAIAFNRFVASA